MLCSSDWLCVYTVVCRCSFVCICHFIFISKYHVHFWAHCITALVEEVDVEATMNVQKHFPLIQHFCILGFFLSISMSISWQVCMNSGKLYPKLLMDGTFFEVLTWHTSFFKKRPPCLLPYPSTCAKELETRTVTAGQHSPPPNSRHFNISIMRKSFYRFPLSSSEHYVPVGLWLPAL